jgi:tagatose-1,6-bisphosphate aldolase non-catalytic subunit AgaZ/GatZ
VLQAIQQAQSALQQNLNGYNINNLILFQYIPFAAVDVDAAALEALANSPLLPILKKTVFIRSTSI